MSSCSKDTVGEFTPGPLYVGNDRDADGFAYYYVGPEDEQAARFYYEGEASGDRALADATLYAAAPDLLEALRAMVNRIDNQSSLSELNLFRCDGLLGVARAAISKSTSANAGAQS